MTPLFYAVELSGSTKCGNLSENLLMFQVPEMYKLWNGRTSRNIPQREIMGVYLRQAQLVDFNRRTHQQNYSYRDMARQKILPPPEFNIDLPKMTPYLKGDTFSKAHHFWYRYRPMICGCLSSLPFFLATDRFHLGSPKRFLRLEIFADKTRLPVIVKKKLVMANATSSRQILFNMQWQRNNV